MKSLGHAWDGLMQALKHERNFRLFCAGFGIVLLAGAFTGLAPQEWISLLLSGGLFTAIELLNTALEHAIDVIEEHRTKSLDTNGYHAGLKAAKDVAAAAALVSFAVSLFTIGMLFLPRLLQ